jgi:hypothetical protein
MRDKLTVYLDYPMLAIQLLDVRYKQLYDWTLCLGDLEKIDMTVTTLIGHGYISVCLLFVLIRQDRFLMSRPLPSVQKIATYKFQDIENDICVKLLYTKSGLIACALLW